MAQNEYIQKEVQNIIKENASDETKSLALAATWIIAHFKGINLRVYDVKDSSSLADYYVVASAGNITQARAMTHEIQVNLKQAGSDILSTEGLTDGEWILVDAGDVIVHIFNESSRDIFDLDRLWAKHPLLEIPESYYYAGHDDDPKPQSGNSENYF